MYTDTPLTKRNIRDAAAEYCAHHHIAVKITFDATVADEGGFDRTAATVVVGRALTEAPDWAGYYFLFRMLVEAHEVLRPADFDALTARSKDYRIGANGKCAKWTQGGWRVVDLNAVRPRPAAYWQAAALNMPHEVEAGEIAVEETYDLLTHDCQRDNLHNLHYMAHSRRFERAEYPALFDEIDALVP